MNYNTIIVNTARGKIIKNLDCLMAGLKSLRIGGLGLMFYQRSHQTLMIN